MKVKKLLFVTKFEELWFDALESLMDLRKVGLNHVVFLNVIENASDDIKHSCDVAAAAANIAVECPRAVHSPELHRCRFR